PEREAMTDDTIFDLASLTKPLATATSILILAERGAIAIDDPASKYVPEFGRHGKEAVTIRQLLTHTSGLPPETPLSSFRRGLASAMNYVYDVWPQKTPGEKFTYSDVGFLVLEEVVRRVTGQELDEFTATNVYTPLGMRETEYHPDPAFLPRIAPTE